MERRGCNLPFPTNHRTWLMDQTLEQRFWARVDRNGKRVPHMATRCWAWTGAKTNEYGSVPTGIAKHWLYAHRFSYELHHGTPDGMVCHRCDNRECCNPEHLYDGDASSNMQDVVDRTPNYVPASRKVSAELVAEMEAMIAEGQTYRAVGRKFSVSDTTVRNWVSGKYSHIS